MFSKDVYIKRRRHLKDNLKNGLILLPGHVNVPMNYPANCYRFRQESNFLYFIGLDYPGLAAIIDIDNDMECIFGNDASLDDIIWTGPQQSLADKAALSGIEQTFEFAKLQKTVQEALAAKRQIHFLPSYRAETKILLHDLLALNPSAQKLKASVELIKNVIKLRSIKEPFEITEIEQASEIAYLMHVTAMKMARPGILESEIAGAIEGIAISMGMNLSFPAIVTKNGQTLHNHYHGNKLSKGDLLLVDAGIENHMRYATDHTRTCPVGGSFSSRQRDIYNIVLDAQLRAIEAIKPGNTNKDVHMLAVETIANGLKDLGIMKGNISMAVEKGAHALFMPHGLGHMLGLDVHDMEDLGENFVGYDDEVKRSEIFGTAFLRLGRRYQPGFVLTVEPGCYFIPQLIEKWRSEKRFTDYINYDKVSDYLDFGGIRIEDDILVTETGCRVLGKAIPKTVAELEAITNT